MTLGNPLFQQALAAIDRGSVEELAQLLQEHPQLPRARWDGHEPPYDGYFHGATLLQHLAGNPFRCRLPDETLELATLLLEKGADPEATVGGGPSQPTSVGGFLGLVVSSAHAQQRQLTLPLVDLLLARDVSVEGGGRGSVLWTALYHVVENRGQLEIARALYDRGHPVDLVFAAGLGLGEEVQRHLRANAALPADALFRHHRGGDPAPATPQLVLQDAVLAACVGDHPKVVNALADAGADLDVARRWGPWLVTPLHAAAWAGSANAVELLLAKGAEAKVRDPAHNSTPLGWARHCGQTECATILSADDQHLDLFDALELGRSERFFELLDAQDKDAPEVALDDLLSAARSLGHDELVKGLRERASRPTKSSS